MFTTVDKALTAVAMGLLSIGSIWFGWDFGLTPDTVSVIIAAVTPFFVWLVPNKTV